MVPDYVGSDAPAYAGVVMFPWAGRIPNGRWADGNELRELPINDLETPSALHGLLCFEEWEVMEHSAEVLRLGYTLEARRGYPYSLRIEVVYSLFSDKLVVHDTVTNVGSQVAPFALAHHPYFALLGAELSDLTIDSSIRGIMKRTPQKIPVEKVELGPTPRIEPRGDVDDTYLLDFSDKESSTHRLHTPVGVIELWQGNEWPWLHVYATSSFPSTSGPIPVVALEPHTAVPNSLNWPDQLIRLKPGARWSGQWGVSFSALRGLGDL